MAGIDRLPSLLRERRTDLGFTQEHLASCLGVKQSTIARWEKGTRTPSGALMLRLCWLLRISYNEMNG